MHACKLHTPLCSYEWKHTIGGAKIVNHHIVFFFHRSHVWTYYDGFSQCFCILWLVKIQRSQMGQKNHFFQFHVMWCYVIFVHIYIYIYIYIYHNILKNENILKKGLKWFVVFMKFVIFTKHYDSIWLDFGVCIYDLMEWNG